jgi:dihydrofolate synthase/folylpolyglutamate synthase
LGLFGPHQRRNAAIAQAAARAIPGPWTPQPSAVQEGFERAWLPGRFDRRGRWIFDVAHNAAGVQTLAAAIAATKIARPLHVVFGALGDKDGATMVAVLAGVADRLWVTVPPGAPHDRLPDPASWVANRPEARFEPAFEAALDAAGEGARTILVTGSFYTVGAALARLPGFAPFG